MKKLLSKAIVIALAVGMQSCDPGWVFTKYLQDAPLDEATWESSKWIAVADAPVVTGNIEQVRAADGASWFATTVKNDKKIVSAKIVCASLGVYDLYVNGHLVAPELMLKPGFTHPEKTKLAQTYDLTPAFNAAKGSKNEIAVEVTPGWWADKIVTPWGNDGMLGKKCAFRGVLELEFADGTKRLCATDTENWRAAIAGRVKHAGIFDGEDYDARETEGFLATETFGKPEESTEFQGEVLATNGAEVYLRQDLALSPVKAYVWEKVEGQKEEEFGKVVVSRSYDKKNEPMTIKPGETLVIDFGQNSSAVPAFEFAAKEGTKLTCLPSEILNDGNGARSRGMDGPEGSVHRENLRAHKDCIILTYIFGNNGRNHAFYTPRKTFFGYRHLSITATDEVKIYDVKSVPVTSIGKQLETGKISTGNDLINKLISNTLWGQRSNYLSVPTDCPQRDERLGWMADTQVFTETGTFFADTRRFFHKWMRDVRDSQGEEGGFPGVSPKAQYGNELNRLGWSDAGVICPWTIWKQFGDTQMVDESWDSMEKYLDHITPTKYNHQAHVAENGNYQWNDWLSYEPLESCSGRAFGQNGPLPETLDYWNYMSASYWLIDAEMMVDMARATGRDAAKYTAIAAEAREYIRNEFFTPEGLFKTDILNTMQTPALFALKNRILEGAQKEEMIARLRKNFEEHENCLQTGFLGTSILMATLTENGMVDIAYELLYQRKNPSWLYSVDNGATTIWERWNSYMIDKGMGPQGMNSFNHYAYGAVCEWIWETCAGIAADPAEPGFKHIIMKPVPDKRLGHLDAEYKSAAGTIKSSWRYDGDEWTWTFTVPGNATATVTLPGATESRDYTAGTYTVSCSLAK